MFWRRARLVLVNGLGLSLYFLSCDDSAWVLSFYLWKKRVNKHQTLPFSSFIFFFHWLLMAAFCKWNVCVNACLLSILSLNSICNVIGDMPQQDEPSSPWLPREENLAPVWCQPSWGETSVRKSSVTWRAERWGGRREEMGDSGRMNKKQQHWVGQMRPQATDAAAVVVVVCACQVAICFHFSYKARLLSRLC